MSLFLWKRSYEINIPEIDVQHRRLVGMINELADAMMMQKGQRTLPHILEEMEDYIQLHFTTEETIMRKENYLELEEHVIEHTQLTRQFLEYKDKYYLDHDLDPKALLDFLCRWLKNHISVNDKAFGEFICRAERGME